MVKLINLTDKAVSKKLPDKEWVTLEPGEQYNFPNVVGYYGDPRLSRVEKEVEKKPASKGVLKRIKDVAEDLLDDGKLNYSNNPKKKSPGRKRKAKKK